jgi:hypothetical protein
MSATTPLTDDLRAKGQELAQRLQNDPSFRQEVESDPAAAMRAAGIPEGAAADFLRETGVSADVSGYQVKDDWCFWTCFITGPR